VQAFQPTTRPKRMNLTRSSGILFHPTSLPGGRLGDEAYRFVDWLERAGQSWWQILPLGPPGPAASPYASPSAFAGWDGLLADPDAEVTEDEAEAYVARHPYWIGHWASYAGGDAIADQVRFDREWGALREYAAARGIRIIGDVPIYVANDGADHRAFPELFQKGVVAGVPPDDFSKTGQLWGNPIYDWNTMRETGFRWWVERFRRILEHVDLVRIDHFRGLIAYWAVPDGNVTAKSGQWRRAPGRDLMLTLRRELGDLPVIAEDLGVITPPVEKLRDDFGLPGMVVIQWAFNEDATNPHSFARHLEKRVVYTGTHDNETIVGWWAGRSDSERAMVAHELERAKIEEDEINWALIRLAFSSRGRLAVVPLQDVLGLDNDARMNAPGTTDGNWQWRLEDGQLTDELADRLRAATEQANRLPAPGQA
jgi:4-alpha-glucanotransferase